MIINTRKIGFKLFLGILIIIIIIYNSLNNYLIRQELCEPDKSCSTNSTESELNLIFESFFKQSEEQLLVNRLVLLKTMRYMMEERDELDPELVAFVRSLIVPPPAVKGKPNLEKKDRTDFSQIGQSKYIDSLLGSKTNGFFIESGAFDGEGHSNSLFFELERNWQGILIEPIPSLYQTILTKKRNVHVLNACIAGKLPLVAKFRVLHVLSVRVAEMSDAHKRRMDKEGVNNMPIVHVPCFSLNTIMAALRVENVDYFSLDVEGGEWSVISNLDLKRINIKSFSIEYNGNQGPKNLIKDHLLAQGYKYLKEDGQDIYFIKD